MSLARIDPRKRASMDSLDLEMETDDDLVGGTHFSS